MCTCLLRPLYVCILIRTIGIIANSNVFQLGRACGMFTLEVNKACASLQRLLVLLEERLCAGFTFRMTTNFAEMIGVSRAVISASTIFPALNRWLLELQETNGKVGITTNEASELMGQIRSLKDKVERLMV